MIHPAFEFSYNGKTNIDLYMHCTTISRSLTMPEIDKRYKIRGKSREVAVSYNRYGILAYKYRPIAITGYFRFPETFTTLEIDQALTEASLTFTRYYDEGRKSLVFADKEHEFIAHCPEPIMIEETNCKHIKFFSLSFEAEPIALGVERIETGSFGSITYTDNGDSDAEYILTLEGSFNNPVIELRAGDVLDFSYSPDGSGTGYTGSKIVVNSYESTVTDGAQDISKYLTFTSTLPTILPLGLGNPHTITVSGGSGTYELKWRESFRW